MKHALIVAIVGLALVVSACGSEPAGNPAGSLRPSPHAEPSPEWVPVLTMRGSGMYSNASEPFELRGGEQRLSGTVDVKTKIGDVSWQAVNIATDSGGNVVSVSESGSLDARMYLPAGRYYLWGVSTNCTWRVTLYELR